MGYILEEFIMDEKTAELIQETMDKPRWIATAQALMKLLDPQIVKSFGAKYIWWGDYHWRLYYSKTKNKYMGHVDYIVDYFRERKGRLLDIGCGEGLIVKRIIDESDLECIGIDSSPLAIELAHQHGMSNCVLMPFEEFPEKENYDYIFLGDTLEHLENPELALKKTKQLLADDGTLFISFPTQNVLGIGDLHLFTIESARELIELSFTVESFDFCKEELNQMYFAARKPEFFYRKNEEGLKEQESESLEGESSV